MGTGGSRYGAGHPGWRRKCEQLNWLDIRQLHRRSRLSPGQYFSWSWSRGDEPCGTIGIKTFEHEARLIYRWTPYGRDPVSMDYPVSIHRMPCHYGGTRPWFLCPRCYRQCAVIYGVATNDGRFGCRHCMRLAHSSEAESPMDRLWRKSRKLEGKLFEGEFKPKGMHNRTFERLCDKLDQVEQCKDELFAIRAWPFFQRTGLSLEDLLK